MKPYLNQVKATPYTLGISNAKNYVDQKRNLVQLRPGHQIFVKVIPKMVQTSEGFDDLDVETRQCKLPHETSGFQFLTGPFSVTQYL